MHKFIKRIGGDKDLEQNLEQNIDYTVEHTVAQNIDYNINHNTDHNIEQNKVHNIEHNIEQNKGYNKDYNKECNIKQNIDYNNMEFESNDQFNRFLLYTYLKSSYLANNATEKEAIEETEQLMLKHKDNLFGYHGIAYQLGATNLEFFSMYFLQNIFIGEGKATIAPIHSAIWQEVQDTILDKSNIQQIEYLLPRGTGKSTFISLVAAIWCSVYKYKSYTLIASAIGDTASTFIRNIKIALEGNNRIEKAFGKLYDTKKCINNTEQIELTNKTMIQSISASSTLRGKSYGNTRVELLLLDKQNCPCAIEI